MNWEQIERFEKWLPVVGYEGLYEVSDWGRVRSLARARTPGKILVQTITTTGYPMISLWNGRERKTTVHQLVAEAFIGPCPFGKQIDHINGDRSDCTVLNLRYVTQRENNYAMRERHGKWPWAKLTAAEVIEIRRLRKEGMSGPRIAQLFGIAHATVYRIVRNKTWNSERQG